MKRVLIMAACAGILTAGCVTGGMKEAWRGFRGDSTKVLSDTRPSAVSREFMCGRGDCVKKVEESLKELKAYVYAREGELIAVYVSEEDTTPVGIFISAAEGEKARIEVSSPSSFARDALSAKLFASLEKKLKAKKIEVQLDAVEGGH